MIIYCWYLHNNENDNKNDVSDLLRENLPRVVGAIPLAIADAANQEKEKGMDWTCIEARWVAGVHYRWLRRGKMSGEDHTNIEYMQQIIKDQGFLRRNKEEGK